MAQHIRWWHITAVVLAILLVGALSPRSAHAEAGDIVFEGAVAGGGTLRLTLTADSSGVTSVGFSDIQFSVHGACGLSPVSRFALFVPPVDIVGGSFSIGIAFGDPHHADPYTIQGTLLDETHIEGTVSQGASLDCQGTSDDQHWSLELVPADQRASDLRFAGALAGGEITVSTNSERSQLTAVKLQNVELPCLPRLDVDFIFVPVLELRTPGDYFLGVVPLFYGEPRTRTFLNVEAGLPRPDVIGGFVDAGVFCEGAARQFIWSAWLATAPTPTAAPALPQAGLPPSEEQGLGPWPALASAILGGLLLTLGLRLRLR